MARDYVWIVETREESNPWTGERKGLWYPCGYEVHRTREEARQEGRRLGGRGPRRAVRYVRETPDGHKA